MGVIEKEKVDGGQVVITVSGQEAPKYTKDTPPSGEGATMESSATDPTVPAKQVPAGAPPSPEIARLSPSSNRPPKVPSSNEGLIRRKSLARSIYSKPKSRIIEQGYPVDATMLEEHAPTLREHLGANSFSKFSFNRGSPNNKSARSVMTDPVTPKTSYVTTPGRFGDYKDEEIYQKVKLSREKDKRVTVKTLIELGLLMCLVGVLIASLTVGEFKKHVLWGLEVWKWCVLVTVTFGGMLITNWFMHFVVFLIEMNFLLRKKVLYFVHGLKKSVQVFIWLSLVLLTWVLLFEADVKHSDASKKILHYVTWTIVSLLIGAFLLLVKTLLLKILASNFNVNNFFERIQESIFHQYILQTLSGPALVEEAEKVGRDPSSGQLSFRTTKNGKLTNEKRVIDMGKVHKIKQGKVSAWTMRLLVESVRNSRLSTISDTLDDTADEGHDQTDKEITNEMEAVAAAYYTFINVAQPGCDYIYEDDLRRFMIKEEVDLVFPLFEGFETGRITRKALTDWVVKVYNNRKALAHSLNDTKTAVRQLNKLITAILIAVTVIIWLLLMEIATTKVILFFSTQLVALAFIIGSTCRTLFESIVFVFVMHPFDVGDRCVVDGVPMIVEEMNLLTTVFLKLNNEKVFYPNSVLATKPISNYFRSPEMGDTVEFSIDFSTPVEKIGFLKEKIKNYLESNPQHWQPNHLFVVQEIENMNKIKMVLYPNHTINFQDYKERNLRRTELVIALKRMFEELNIKYNLLPQQVHLAHVESGSVIMPGG